LCDIASHQIDQFLHFTNSISAEIVTSSVANYANPSHAGLEDFGEVVLQSNASHGYIRVDWYTADALPTWGDGRLFILGTRGTIEIRKYIDIAGRTGTDHVLMVNNERVSYFDASKTKLNYFFNFSNDVKNRTETSCSQAHTFLVTELALKSQKMASRLGFLSLKN
jgi:predicted dehydrogenase